MDRGYKFCVVLHWVRDDGCHFPYEFIGFGSMDFQFPYEFTGFGVHGWPVSLWIHRVWGNGSMDDQFPHELIRFGTMDGP